MCLLNFGRNTVVRTSALWLVKAGLTPGLGHTLHIKTGSCCVLWLSVQHLRKAECRSGPVSVYCDRVGCHVLCLYCDRVGCHVLCLYTVTGCGVMSCVYTVTEWVVMSCVYTVTEWVVMSCVCIL